MKRTTIQVGLYEVNCSIVEIDGKTYVIDPGSEGGRIVQLLQKADIVPHAILLTHAHFDHIGGIPALEASFPGIAVYAHPDDFPAFTHPMNQLPPEYPPIARAKNLHDARELTDFTVIETPGHTPGGVCYFLPSADNAHPATLFSGDTLFAGSIGRTDFPGGDMATLMHSLEKLKTLPPATQVIPGHGMFTTIQAELAGNPFLQ